MPALFLTADLVFSSRVAGVARQLGQIVVAVGTPAALIERCQAEAAPLVILDLSLPRLDIEAVVGQLQSLPSPPTAIAAYAPHVHEQLLAQATAVGCTEVLTRGQFNAEIERVLKQYLASDGG